MQAAMTAGQALDWMIAHPGEELEDSDGDRWREMDNLSSEYRRGRGTTWIAFDMSLVDTRITWHIPERKLPKLPKGAVYVLNDVAQYVRCRNGYHFYFVSSPEVAEVYRALAEEFETRPK